MNDTARMENRITNQEGRIMKIHFDYPLATNENIEAIRKAFNTMTEPTDLYDEFNDEVLWDCFVVMSGQQNTPWALMDYCDGNEQYSPENWQRNLMDEYYEKCMGGHEQ